MARWRVVKQSTEVNVYEVEAETAEDAQDDPESGTLLWNRILSDEVLEVESLPPDSDPRDDPATFADREELTLSEYREAIEQDVNASYYRD